MSGRRRARPGRSDPPATGHVLDPSSPRADGPDAGELFERIYAAVERVPPGRVTTYGAISLEVTGRPTAARTVGWALNGLPEERFERVPWWRVINAAGRISNSSRPGVAHEQRERLEAEGVRFGLDGRVDLDRFGWEG